MPRRFGHRWSSRKVERRREEPDLAKQAAMAAGVLPGESLERELAPLPRPTPPPPEQKPRGFVAKGKTLAGKVVAEIREALE